MIKIRYGVFETNSSSVHSLVMCSENEYNDFIHDKLLYNALLHKFITKKEALDKLFDRLKDNFSFQYHFGKLSRKDLDNIPLDEIQDYLAEECNIFTSEYYFSELEFETFEEKYITNSGETIYAFGYYGHD